jgi:thiol-disulfide isomerase/thioredoxin
VAYLAAAVVVVGLLCLVNLVLTFGVIRRLREHTNALGNLPQQMGSPLGIAIGGTPGDFTATTTTGETVSRAGLAGPVLVGFFSPGCEPCATELPHFVEYAKAMPGGAERVLAVIDGGPAEASEYVERLEPVAQVVPEGHEGPVKSAFKLAAYPTIYLLGADGTVVGSGTMVSDIGPVPELDIAAA